MAEKKSQLTLEALLTDDKLREKLGLTMNDVQMARLNAEKYEKTDAGIEDAVIKSLWGMDKVKESLGRMASDEALDLEKQFSREYGKTKKLSATEILKALNQPFDKAFDKGRYDTPEQKIIALYDTNPNHVRNVVRRDKDFGKAGADNLDAVVYNLKEREKDLKGRNPNLATKILMPRVAESISAGRDPSATDYTLDIVENGLMALPLGTALKGYRAGNLAKNALGLATEIAAVPALMEGLDTYSYDEFSNPERADYSPLDVGAYSLTNLVAPWIANRIVNKAGKMAGVGKSAPVLEGIAKQDDAAVKMLDDATMYTLDDAAVKAMADDIYAKKVAGIDENKLWETAGSMLGPNRRLGEEEPVFDKLVREAYSQARKEADSEAMSIAAKMADEAKQAADEAAKIAAKQLADEAAKRARIDNAKTMAKDVLGTWTTNKLGRQTDANQFLGRVTAGLSQYTDSDVPTIVKQMREEHAEDARNRARTAYAQQVLGQDTLSDEDKLWLGKIAVKPDIVRGFGEGATSEFKNWYLTRGMDLLRGSDVFRPAYDVK